MKKMLMLLLFGLLAAGCAKKQMVKSDQNSMVAPAAPAQTASAPAEEQSSRFSDWQNVPELAAVYFDYDKSELLASSREMLKKNAEYLKANENLKVLIEGHCDERGTVAYNLALGDRRAAAVRAYYALLGVPKERIAIISYGSEKPADPGHTEAAWQKNRRAETKIRGTKVASASSDDTQKQ